MTLMGILKGMGMKNLKSKISWRSIADPRRLFLPHARWMIFSVQNAARTFIKT